LQRQPATISEIPHLELVDAAADAGARRDDRLLVAVAQVAGHHGAGVLVAGATAT
jgi:hypothetical protein